MIRAMMRVTGRNEQKQYGSEGDGPTSVGVTLQPIFDAGSNTSWSQYTPSGELSLVITNPAAFDQIQLGKTFSVTLDEVDPKTLSPISDI